MHPLYTGPAVAFRLRYLGNVQMRNASNKSPIYRAKSIIIAVSVWLLKLFNYGKKINKQQATTCHQTNESAN